MFKVFITQGGATNILHIDGESVSSRFTSLFIQQIHLAHAYGVSAVRWALACRIQIYYEEMINQKEFCKALEKRALRSEKRKKKGKTNNSKEDLTLYGKIRPERKYLTRAQCQEHIFTQQGLNKCILNKE